MAMAATPSPRPVRPRPSVVVAATDTGAPAAADSAASASSRRGPSLRPVADHLDGDVADDGTRRAARMRGRLGEQAHPGGAGQLGPVGAEVRAQVAEPGGREQRVAGGVGGDVAVGVAGQPPLTGPEQAGERQGAAVVGERVDVDADADAGQDVRPVGGSGVSAGQARGCIAPAACVRASSRSRGEVTLNARGSPSTTVTCHAGQLDQRGVVGGARHRRRARARAPRAGSPAGSGSPAAARAVGVDGRRARRRRRP